MRRLLGASCASLVLVSAPAGYGKTTLLAQWARAFEGAVRWLTLGPGHRDPRLLRDEVRRALADAPAPFLLVMDDADALGVPRGARGGVGARRRSARPAARSRWGAGPTRTCCSAGGWWRAASSA